MSKKKCIIQLAIILSFLILALSSTSSSHTTSSSSRGSSSTLDEILEGIQAFATGYQIGSRTAALDSSPGIYIGNAETQTDAENLTLKKGYSYYIWDRDTKRTYAFRSESTWRETYNSIR